MTGTGRNAVLPTVAGILVLTLALFSAGQIFNVPISGDCVVADGIGRLFLANETAGRQALVGSVLWPPLPVLVRLPAAAFLPDGLAAGSSRLLSAVFGAAAAVMLASLIRSAGGSGWLGVATGLGWLALPQVHSAASDGSPSTLAWFLCLLTARGLYRWLENREVAALVRLGAGTAGMFLTSPDSAAWALCILVFLVLDTLASRTRNAQKEAVLILGILPLVYAAGLWMLLCWLVMGDAFYFLRPLAQAASAAAPVLDPAGLPLSFWAPGALALFTVVLAGLAGSRSAALLGASACAVHVAGLALNFAGLIPAGGSFGAVAPALSVAAVAALAHSRLPRQAAAPLTVATGACIACFSFFSPRATPPLPQPANTAARVERHVAARSPHATVIVCGYDGFRLLRGSHSPVFVQSLDLDVRQVMADYAGHALFLLVPRPAGRAALESVHRKYPDIHRYGVDGALYDGDWNGWRLFQLFPPPTSELPPKH